MIIYRYVSQMYFIVVYLSLRFIQPGRNLLLPKELIMPFSCTECDNVIKTVYELNNSTVCVFIVLFVYFPLLYSLYVLYLTLINSLNKKISAHNAINIKILKEKPSKYNVSGKDFDISKPCVQCLCFIALFVSFPLLNNLYMLYLTLINSLNLKKSVHTVP